MKKEGKCKMRTPKSVKKALIKLLKASKKQFYDEDGMAITVEEYVDKVCSYPLEEVLAYQKKLKGDQAAARNKE